MSNYKINLYSGRIGRPINPQVSFWNKRLSAIFFVLFFIFFANLAAWGAGKYIVSDKSGALDNSISSMKKDIEDMKDIEGLYLILDMRLKKILNYKDEYINLSDVYKVFNENAKDTAEIKNIVIEQDKYTLTVSFQKEDNAEEFIKKLLNSNSYQDNSFVLSEPVIESTKIDSFGKYLIVLKGEIQRNK